MKQTRFLGFLPVFCLLALPALRAQSQNELKLEEATAEFNSEVSVSLTLSSTDEVQGVVAVFEWDTTDLTGIDLVPATGAGEALENADQVVTRAEAGFMILGVVMDTDGGGVDIIPPGDDILLATATFQCGAGPEESLTDLVFVDGAHAAVDGGPSLDNIVVIGGLSVGETDGLTLTGGSVRCTPAPDKLIIESGGNEEGEEATAGINVLMNNRQEVEGFVTAVCHDPADLTLNDVVLGADAAQADFAQAEFAPDGSGAAFGVVIDLVEPMKMPPNIDPGNGNHIATYTYTCENPPEEGEPDIVVPLSFCDNVIGDPLKENLIVIGGLSVAAADGLVLEDGTFTCRPAFVPEVPDTERGLCDDGEDNDQDGLVDDEDPDCQVFDFEFVDPVTLLPAPVVGSVGVPMDALLGYNAPTEESLGIGGSGGNVLLGDSPRVAIQGFSLGFSYNCDEVAAGETFDTSGTILETLGAEFVGVSADNDAEDVDGDPCSLTLGVLVDAMPPFDGRVIPALEETQPLGRLQFTVLEGIPCGESVLVVGQDGVNGKGKVPVRNVISVDNLPFRTSVRDLELVAAEVERFFRGDCNFTGTSRGLDPVEIADAAAVISFLFQKSIFKFDPPCLDACDANDDGRVDLADAVGILNYLFLPGAKFPPAPGPGLDETTLEPTDPGGDPTPDPLDCDAGTACDFQ